MLAVGFGTVCSEGNVPQCFLWLKKQVSTLQPSCAYPSLILGLLRRQVPEEGIHSQSYARGVKSQPLWDLSPCGRQKEMGKMPEVGLGVP